MPSPIWRHGIFNFTFRIAFDPRRNSLQVEMAAGKFKMRTLITSVARASFVLVLFVSATSASSEPNVHQKSAEPSHHNRVIINEDDLNVAKTLTFDQQVQAYANIITKLDNAKKQADQELKVASDANDALGMKAALEDQTNIRKASLTFGAASIQAQELVDEGWKLNDWSGNVCKVSQCQPISAQTAYFFFAVYRDGLGAQFADLYKKMSEKPKTGNRKKASADWDIEIQGVSLRGVYHILSNKPLDTTTFGILPQARELILVPLDPHGTGLFTKMIRDPGREPIAIVQNIRDHIIPTKNNSVAEQVIHDPIKCTFGRIFHKCHH